MRSTDTPRARLAALAARRRAFYTADWERVTERNLRNVKAACVIAAMISLWFTPIARLVAPSWQPTVAHMALAPVALVLALCVVFAGKQLASRPRAAAAFCLAVEAVLLACVVLLDTVFSGGRPGILTQPVGIGLGVLIVTPWGLPLWVLGAADAAFIALSVTAKVPDIAAADAFSVCVGYVVAIAVAELALALRLQDFEARERYRELSERDALTGLLNRGALATFTSRLFAGAGGSAARGAGSSATLAPAQGVCVMMLDLDDFKQVNDQRGHDAGDDLLRLMGDILRTSFRTSDAVVRYGGDEFMVVAPGLTDEHVASAKVEHVCAELRERGSRLVDMRVSCSAGVVVAPQGAASFEELLREADQALYEVKGSSKGGYAYRVHAPHPPQAERRGNHGGGERIA
ncbi:GGDEF domain-containing protein [Collinsella sp. An307]|uniref:GGDEF domain-containing protein n=1 Tax=Collinsella sp. An307 TaxID=1965630 RepID=UPI000B36DD27|nr:GGDEF domain-containing protein [Collinsella sp. An307]OUO19002.1 hypothetical protein B5F89_08735 [Collinsella sp. An307]